MGMNDMAYSNMLDAVLGLYSDLKKKRERLLKKKQKLDVELILIARTDGFDEDLEEEQMKTEIKLKDVEYRLERIEKGLNGDSTLDNFIPELKKMEAEQ